MNEMQTIVMIAYGFERGQNQTKKNIIKKKIIKRPMYSMPRPDKRKQ